MIHCNQTPLSEPELKQLRELMGQPGLQVLIRFLQSKAALLSAESGNLMIESAAGGFESKKADAEEKAQEATRLLAFVDLLNQMRIKEFAWFRVELSAKPTAI